jgi:hypothetical protein
LLKGTRWPKEMGVGFIRQRKSRERQVLRKTWCRDDGHADRRQRV